MNLARLKATPLVAGALPIRVASCIGAAVGARRAAARLRGLVRGIPVAAYVVTGLVWVVMIPNGILYPVLDSANLNHSWGGPTLVGAWATHFAIGAAVLLAAALPFALWRPPGRQTARL